MSYSSVLTAVRVAGRNYNAAGEVFAYLVSTGTGTFATIRDTLQLMGATWSGGAELLADAIANVRGYAAIRAALVSTGVAKDGGADLLAYEISNGTVQPPGSPSLWFDAQNIDGTSNSSMVDGQAIGTWKNLGSLGSAGDSVQATAGNKPAFRLIAVPGVFGNKPGIECIDVNRRLISAAIANITQPYTVASVIRTTKAATQVHFGGQAPLSEFYNTVTTDHVNSGLDVDTVLNPSANQFHGRVYTVNGAASNVRIDGVQSATINAGGTGFGTPIVIGCDPGIVLGTIGFINEVLVWSGAISPALIETYFASKWGTTPA